MTTTVLWRGARRAGYAMRGANTARGLLRRRLLALAFLAFLTPLAACGAAPPPTSGSPPATATVDQPMVAASVVGSAALLQMESTTTGWAATTARLLHTTDGGRHWRDVTPPAPALSAAVEITAFPLSATEAWVMRGPIDAGAGTGTGAGGTSTGQSALSHTTDGGQSWQTRTLAVTGVIDLTFADAEDGWIVAQGPPSPAGGAPALMLWRTRDGGQTWTPLAGVAGNSPGGVLPQAGRLMGLTFRDATDGWATFAEASPTAGLTTTVTAKAAAAGHATPRCYRTLDGGVTWQPVMLPLPADMAQEPWFYVASVASPRFFSPQVGVLLVGLGSTAAGGVVRSLGYMTQDGGISWTPTVPVDTEPFAVSMLDATHWWIAADADVGGAGLVSTADGGQHWSTLAPALPFAHVRALCFVSDTQGWALAGAGLLRTRDGGRTWTVVLSA